MKIGNLKLSNPFILAPMAGFTDKTMRTLCREQGASLTFTEMVSAKGLKYGDRKTRKLLELEEIKEKKCAGNGTLELSMEKGPVGETDISDGIGLSGETVMNAAAGLTGFQIFGSEPDILAFAARELACEKNAILDLNCGCPVPKIVKNGEGSALLKNLDLLYDCVAAMVRGAKEGAEVCCRKGVSETPFGKAEAAAYIGKKVSAAMGNQVNAESHHGSRAIEIRDRRMRHGLSSGRTVYGACEAKENTDGITDIKPVTAKIRMGFERDDNVAVEAAKAIEAAGAAAVTVHGRTRQQYYEGAADWDVIRAVKAAVSIPVIGNGDVKCGEDAIRMMKETGCDGVMIARGALGNPWIFSEAIEFWNNGEIGENPWSSSTCATSPISDEERIQTLIRHLKMLAEDKGEHVAVCEIRKFVGPYTRGMHGAAALRREANTISSVNEMVELLTK